MSGTSALPHWPVSRLLGAQGPLVFGILNVTPDSFSDGGRFVGRQAAVDQAARLWEEGADVIDVGGESTRPGASPVSPDQEAERVLPVVEAIVRALPGAQISVDTRRAAVAEQACAAGVSIVNDVSAGADPEMVRVVREAGAGWVLMHMRGSPRTMQDDTSYDDLVGEVHRFLSERVRAACDAGVPRRRLLVDPGLGFGKSLTDNPRLIASLGQLAPSGVGVLIGASRKRFIGALTGIDDPKERLAGSLGAACAALEAGAAAVRVHDVGATIQALQVYRACRRE